MGRDLSALQIKDSYQYLLQKSGSAVNDGVGNDITSLDISASFADSATSASYASTALSASYATTASFALNVSTPTLQTVLDAGNTATQDITLVGDITATSFTGSLDGNASTATSASYATTASHAIYAETAGGATDVNALYTASVSDATIAFLKGGGSTFDITVNNVVNADSASYVAGANVDGAVALATTASHALYSDTAGSATTATSASHAVNADTAISSSYALTASYAEFHADSTLQQVLNAGNTATGSIDLLGDITATTFIGALQGNADTATSASHALASDTAISASHALNADNAISSSYATFAVSASNVFAENNTQNFNYKMLVGVDNAYQTPQATQNILVNPSASSITATTFNGNASTATTASYALTASYLEGGVSLQTVLDTGNTATQDMTLNGALDVSGSVSFEGTLQGLLRDNDDINIVYDGATLNSSPNIFIGAYSGSSTLVAGSRNNIVIGSAGSYNSGKNRLLEIEADNNTIIGGYNNYMSGSRPSNSTILGGVGNTMNKLGTAPTSMYVNAILGGASNDILAGGYNVILGGSGNDIDFGDVDTSPNYNIIGGGGSTNIIGGDYNGVIAGYNHDIIGGKQSVIIGGEANMISQSSAVDMDSVIVGGRNNTLYEHQRSVILGGDGLSTTKDDEAVAKNLTISGELDGSNNLYLYGGFNMGVADRNTMTGESGSGILGGYDNSVSQHNNQVLGGRGNVVRGTQGLNFAIGGEYHDIDGFRCGAVGGESSQVNGTNVVAVSGYGNIIGGTYGAFAGGNGNNIGGTSYFAGGVVNSNGSGYIYAMIGGNGLDCQTDSTLLGGGENNTSVSGHRKGAIIGGNNNTLNGNDTDRAVILGGEYNTIQSGSSQNSAIVGGSNNTTLHSGSVILGGDGLTTTAHHQVVVPNLKIAGEVQGATRGEVNTISIASNTGSMDCSLGNYFEITLQNGVDTHLTATNLGAGQTINLKVTNNATSAGTLSFQSGTFAFEGGVPFSVTSTTNAVDLLSFTSFNGSVLYGSGLNNFS